jgi:glutaminyl-tRNA synthetase
MVRLKHAYIIKCDEIIKDDKNNVIELRCTYFPESRSGKDTSGIHVKGTLHWVAVQNAITAEVRLYDRLFKVEDPATEEGDFKEYINPASLQTITTAYAEPALKNARMQERYQFLRKGYKRYLSSPCFQQNCYFKGCLGKRNKKIAFLLHPIITICCFIFCG